MVDTQGVGAHHLLFRSLAISHYLQYAITEGEGLGDLVMCGYSGRGGWERHCTHHSYSHKMLLPPPSQYAPHTCTYTTQPHLLVLIITRLSLCAHSVKGSDDNIIRCQTAKK